MTPTTPSASGACRGRHLQSRLLPGWLPPLDRGRLRPLVAATAAALVAAALLVAPAVADPPAADGAEPPDDRRVEIFIRNESPAAVERWVFVDGEGDGEEDGEAGGPVRLRRVELGEGRAWMLPEPEGDGEPVELRRFLMARGYLGVRLLELSRELRLHFGGFAEAGLLVAEIESGGAAERAGIEVGDLVTAIDGEAVAGTAAVARRLAAYAGGDRVAVELVRDGELMTLEATLAERQRVQLDVGPLLVQTPPGSPRGVPVLSLDAAKLGEVVGAWRERIESPEWRGARLRQSALEERIQELERRLRELEQELERLPE